MHWPSFVLGWLLNSLACGLVLAALTVPFKVRRWWEDRRAVRRFLQSERFAHQAILWPKRKAV